MKLWQKLFLALMLVSVLPIWFLSRYASSFFHHFTRNVQEEQMAQTGRWAGSLFREISSETEREKVLAAYAGDSGRRLRYFSSRGELLYDSGETEPVFFDGNAEVSRAIATQKYAARWWLKPDRSHLYYFTAVPVFDEQGELLGVMQVVEHTGRITRALIRLHTYQKSGLLWGIGGSICLSILFSLLLTRRLRTLETAAREFARAGGVEGFRMRGRDEVSKLAAEFLQMAEELQEKQHYNREFVQTTLHELKTPLTAMHGAADILKTRPQLSDKDRTRFSSNIQIQSDRLLHLVKELELLTSLDMELPREFPPALPLGPAVREILDRISPALQHAVELRGGELQTPIRISPARLEQVLINLLQNADRYHCGDGKILVRLDPLENGVELAVEDEGPGITEQDPLRIFERYFTTVPRDLSQSYGRGLGLAIVKRIMEHFGGRVFAANRPEGGACVGVVFTDEPFL
ncbi:MAG: sensor histidine kinase [Kiritimatiellia bacterium]